MNRKLQVTGVGMLALLACAATAGAAAFPAQKGALGFGADPQAGIVDPNPGGSRYTAIKAGSGTLVQRISTSDGHIEASVFHGGQLAIPAVAYDGSPGGLSADGNRLVLSEPGLRFPQRDSAFTVLDPDRLHILDTVTLPGTWTYDALSPNGRWLYLIEYTSQRDITQYEVRRYDLDRGRLDPKPIVDPEESAEEMYGSPMTRATSPDSRWAYTLYDASEHPFIHALDTARGTAVCIDLDSGSVPPRRISRMSLEPSPSGSTLSVLDRGNPVAIVDTRSFDVSTPAVDDESTASNAAGTPDESGPPWLLIGLGALGVGALTALVIRRRRRAGDVASDELERLVRLESNAPREQGEKEEARKKNWHPVS
ncbi:MAG TPA: hypothetical protein VHJ54_09250 [Solirubrobacterales bacterium]|jgi:hypothetical protein|nr:hypothetical protein [Solirubrobacterales bacterium]